VLLALLALLAIGIWAFIAAVGNDDNTGSATTSTVSVAPAPAAAGGPVTPTMVAGGGGAALTANGQDVLAVAGDPAALAALASGAVSGRAPVESVVSDEGFWVGTSPETRVFVFITEAARGTQGESPFQVAPGQIVELSGTLEPAASIIPQDLDEADGRSQLEAQGMAIAAQTLQLVQ